MGLIHPVDGRKRSVLTASDIIKSARGQYNLKKNEHEDDQLNRHAPFSESPAFKQMLTESQRTLFD